MLDLAISLDIDRNGTTIIETNHGKKLKAPDWPQDSDFHLVSFSGGGRVAEIVRAKNLANDIAAAVSAIRATGALQGSLPDWYKRLAKYATPHTATDEGDETE